MTRFISATAILICVMAGAEPVQASRQDSCDVIETLVDLPVALAAVRAGQGDVKEFKRNLGRSLSVLGDIRRTSDFAKAEVRTMRIFAGAVREDWKMNGASPGGRQIPGLTSTSTTIRNELSEIAEKFECQTLNISGRSPLWSVGSAPVGPLSLVSLVLVIAGGLLGAGWLLRSKHQRGRKICHVPALLRHEGICTATTMIDISRSGAMVEAPAGAPLQGDVTLHLPRRSIQSRVAWNNNNFVGLTFDERLSAREAEKIAKMTVDTDQPENLTDAAPDCFDPGCHLQCKTHRMTLQMLQNQGVKEA